MPRNRARSALGAGRAGAVTLARHGIASDLPRFLGPHEGWFAGKEPAYSRDQLFEFRQLVLPGAVGAVRDASDRIISPKEDE